MTMDPNVPQQPGFLSRIGQGLGNLFSGYQDAPQVGGATDPFAGLSRNQRMLLGFSALRDAAASLEGRDSNYFTEALGGFEQARERERLRAQGIFQNQVQGLAALGQLRQQINIMRAAQQDTSGLEAMYAQLEALVAGGGAGVVPTGGAIPTGGVVQPTGIGTALPAVPGYEAPSVTAPGGAEAARPTPGVVMDAEGNVVEEYTGEPEQPPAESVLPEPEVTPTEQPAEANAQALAQQVSDLLSRYNMMAASGGDTSAIRAELEILEGQIEEARERGEEAAVQAALNQENALMARNQIALLEQIANAPRVVLESITGPVGGSLRPTDTQQGSLQQMTSAWAVGTPGNTLVGIVDQIAGQQFLEAFNSLRGGGQITQIEGDRALRARQRLTNRVVDTEDYRQAAEELLRYYENVLAEAEGRPLPWSQTVFEESAQRGGTLFTLDGTQVIGRID